MRAIAFVLFLMAPQAWSDTVANEVPSSVTEMPAKPEGRGNWPIELGLGMQMEFHKAVEASAYEPASMPVLQAGVYSGRWLYSVDAYIEKNESESASLRIESERQSLDLWVTRMSQMRARWTPFLGLGLGAYQDQVVTQFGSVRDTALSDVHMNVSAKAGARLSFLNVLYSDLSFKVNKRETVSTVDWGGMLSLGFHL